MKSLQKRNADSHTASVEVTNATRTPWDTRGFSRIARAIVPDGYTLSVVLIGDMRARALNRAYRDKHTASNVLSFPLSDTAGEVFINLARVKREAHQYDLTPEGHAAFLLIHACLHLVGHDHGSRMEEAEQTFLKKFSIR